MYVGFRVKCPIFLTRFGNVGQISFIKLTILIFHVDPSSVFRVDACGQTDGRP